MHNCFGWVMGAHLDSTCVDLYGSLGSCVLKKQIVLPLTNLQLIWDGKYKAVWGLLTSPASAMPYAFHLSNLKSAFPLLSPGVNGSPSLPWEVQVAAAGNTLRARFYPAPHTWSPVAFLKVNIGTWSDCGNWFSAHILRGRERERV